MGRDSRRGWVDGWSPFFPAKEQREAMEAAGVEVIYEAKKSPNKDTTIADYIQALRQRDTVVVYGMNALAKTVDEYDIRIAQLAKDGRKIEDLLTGKTFDGDGILPYALGRSRILSANRMRSPKAARAQGKLGGKPPLPPVEDMKEAKRIWKDLSISTNDEAAAMIGRTTYWCRAHLGGPSGRPKGFSKDRKQ